MGEKGKEKLEIRRPCTEFAEAALPIVTDSFQDFLEKNDPSYKEKIGFIVSCTGPNDSYKIRILSVDGSNAEQYFKEKFGEEPGKGKLEKFAGRNNVIGFLYGVRDYIPKETEFASKTTKYTRKK